MSPGHGARDLHSLLGELGRTRTASGKLRLLARSWKLVQQSSQEERERVALAVGSGWIWRRLERFLLADGELRPWELGVKRVLERVGEADPAELRRLAATLARRDRRGLQDLLQSTLREVLEEEAGLREHASLAESAGSPDDAPRAPVEHGIAPAGEDAQASTPAQADEPVVAPPGPRLEPESEEETESFEVPPLAKPHDAPPRPEPPGRRAPPPRRAAQPGAGSFAPPAGRAPSVPPLAPARHELGAPVAPEAIPAAPLGPRERLARLRGLRAAPERAAALGPDGRAELVAALGPGWAARRALSLLLRSRAVADLDEALRLVARLASPVQRAWCLGDLVAHWPLDAEAERRILAAAPTPATRRRLERRLRRAAAQPPR